MSRVNPNELQRFVSRIFVELGTPEDVASAVADSLVEADLSGHHSHGVRRAHDYANWVADGRLDPTTRPETVRETETNAVVDGRATFGQFVGRKAMDLVTPKAHEMGVAMVAIRNATHLGRVGEWAERATADDLAFVGFTCNPKSTPVAPAGSAEGRLSTNPVTAGLPTFGSLDYPLVLDMATSQVAHGKVKERITAGEPVPAEWTAPYEGKPDPEPMDSGGPGALLPLGGQVSGYKGFGLAAMGELLAGVFSDGYVSGQTEAPHGNEAVFFLADPLQFTTRDAIEDRVTRFREYLAATEMSPEVDIGTAAHGDELLLPGESEYQHRREQQRNGVMIADDDVDLLNSLAADLGLEELSTR